MKRSVAGLLFAASSFSLPTLAEEGGFDNFLLSSPSIISPSQYYQVKAGRFEVAPGFKAGKIEGKSTDLTTDISGTDLGVGYVQTLSNQWILAADATYDNSKYETKGEALEDSESVVRPAVAYVVSPLLTLGASANITNGKEIADGSTESYSYTTLTVGGTLHAELWEGTLALTTQNKDEDGLLGSSPRILAAHGRYRVLPLLALGAAYELHDYSDLEADLGSESNFTLIAETAWNEHSKVEIGLRATKDAQGEKGTDQTTFFLGGSYQATDTLDIGAQVQLLSADAELYKSSANQIALTLTSRN